MRVQGQIERPVLLLDVYDDNDNDDDDDDDDKDVDDKDDIGVRDGMRSVSGSLINSTKPADYGCLRKLLSKKMFIRRAVDF